jgi:F420-dependent oxidoreductase-like protein
MRGLAATVLTALVMTLSTTTAARPVEFGIHTPPENATWEDLVATWQEAEHLGFQSAWVYDHFIPIIGDKDGPVLEGWTALAALAAKTEKIRIGVLVTGNTYRNPAVLAKMATTVDHISNGRLELGIGAGWFEYEHTAYGIPFYTAKERAERFAEAMQVINLLWTADHPTFDGKFYDLRQAPFFPKPVQRPHPPIVIGGKGKKWIMPTVARYADEWNVPIGVTPESVKGRIELMKKECERIGRSPCVGRVSALMPLVSITNIPLAGAATRLAARLLVEKRIARALLAGSPDEIKDWIRQYVDAGVTRVILNLRPPYDRELMRRFAREIMPAFRPGAAEAKPAEKSGK